MKKLFLLVTGLFVISSVFGQFKATLKNFPKNEGAPHRMEEVRLNPLYPAVPPAPSLFGQSPANYRSIPRLVIPKANTKKIKVQYNRQHPTPIAIWGSTGAEEKETSFEEKAYRHLEALAEYLQIKDPFSEFRITQINEGENGYHHARLQQYYRDIRVGNGELTLHFKNGKAEFTSGRYYPTPSLADLSPKTGEKAAVETALAHVRQFTRLRPLSVFERETLGLKRTEAELIIYHPRNQAHAERLAWEITIVPNPYRRQTYYLDAQTGEVIFHYENVCGLHGKNDREGKSPAAKVLVDGPITGTGEDLTGVNRTLNTYVIQNTNILMDGSRPMFNAQASDLPWDPVGAIWTVDGDGGTPINNDEFTIGLVTSTSTVWNDPTAVSAHYNAQVVYEYFANTFGRNSIDGRGGTIISIFNVTDENEEEMDNAFWNGAAIFYGNGNRDFFSLAASLDVAAHEIGHGVTQSEANLEYIGQSGALNEHFSDVFGVMVDRDDWQVGETVTRPSVYPTGALRDMFNPNNGGSRLGHPGWQPAHMDEFQDLPLSEQGDYGGVHVNSGIVNRAFVLFATAVGKNAAEQVYYNALVNILTRSAQFIDMRLAIIQSARQLFPNNPNVAAAAADAFTAVGIVGDEGTAPQEDLPVNTGNEYILFADSDESALRIYTADNQAVWDPLIETNIISKPSITDDGRAFVYVDDQKHIRAIVINWDNSPPTAELITLSANPIWRNAAISRDGRRLAALTDDLDNRIWVFDLDGPGDIQGTIFEISNPSTVEGVATGDVAYADVLEWDFSGEFIMYDALTELNTQGGPVEFWDIGFINVWNNQTGEFGDGFISKLFQSLPDNFSIGNPTFSKNSPNIIAMDALDETDDSSVSILGVNIETGDVGGVWSGDVLNSPNYSVDDRQLIFNAFNQNDDPILGVIDLQDDKINSVEGTAFIKISGAFQAGARMGTWFSTGRRNLNTPAAEATLAENAIKAYPNPFGEQLQIELETPAAGPVHLELFDSFGRRVRRRTEAGGLGLQTFTWPVRDLPAGAYWLRVKVGGRYLSGRVVKGW
jgi:Zn-dependent metalloprotease